MTSIPQLAAIPAFALTIVSIVVFACSVRRWHARHYVRRTQSDRNDVIDNGTDIDLVIAIMFFALGVNAFVAGLAIVGIVKDQNTITFWAAVARSVATIGGVYVAYHWWKNDD